MGKKAIFFGLDKARCQSRLYIRLPDDPESWVSLQCSAPEGHLEDYGTEHIAHSSVHEQIFHWSNQDAEDSVAAYLSLEKKESTKPLVGWRCWDLRQNILISTGVNALWEGPVMTIKGGDRVDREFQYGRRTAGVFAYKSLSLLNQYFLIQSGNRPFGRVDLTGHVIEHQFGYRAQICTIREIWVPKSLVFQFDQKLSRLEEIYQCEVHEIAPKQIIPMISYYSNNEEPPQCQRSDDQ